MLHADERDVVDLRVRALVGAPEIEVLNFRGRLASSGSPMNRAATSRIAGVASSTSSAVTPASGHPMITRGVSPHASWVREPDGLQPLPDRRHVLDPDPVQLHVLPVRDVGDVAAVALARPRDRAELLGAHPPAVDPDPHHEELVLELLRLRAARSVAGDALGALRVETPPTQPVPQILLADRAEPAGAKIRSTRSRTSSGADSFFTCSAALSGSWYPSPHWPSPRGRWVRRCWVVSVIRTCLEKEKPPRGRLVDADEEVELRPRATVVPMAP